MNEVTRVLDRVQQGDPKAGEELLPLLIETHSFQGPDFYRKLGFEQIARIEDNPRGHQHLVFRKQLDACITIPS